MMIRVASFLPFQTTSYLNGHNFIEQELSKIGIKYKKNDNAFVSVEDPTMLQSAADRLNHDIIRDRIEYWSLIISPTHLVHIDQTSKACFHFQRVGHALR